MLIDLTGKRAIVTGASSGLGLHFARLLANRGATVTLAARRKAALDAASSYIASIGGQARSLELDVTDPAAVRAALDGKGFDILINNAGISGAARATDLTAGQWDHVLDTNLKSVFIVAQAVARGMREAGTGGAIVNIASILGQRVAGGVCAYAASKAGAIQLTKALALEWAPDKVRVNALCPGYIETEINRNFFQGDAGQRLIKRIPQRRLGRMEELVRNRRNAQELDGALLLLASDAGSYITGATIEVDGGHLVSSL
jgi:NAD(P)-dependent dehydrogenase (short-subunit alcohol dehydrogenase family)